MSIFREGRKKGFVASLKEYSPRISLKVIFDRVTLQTNVAFEGFEPDEGKLSSPVLRGEKDRNALYLPGMCGKINEI